MSPLQLLIDKLQKQGVSLIVNWTITNKDGSKYTHYLLGREKLDGSDLPQNSMVTLDYGADGFMLYTEFKGGSVDACVEHITGEKPDT